MKMIGKILNLFILIFLISFLSICATFFISIFFPENVKIAIDIFSNILSWVCIKYFERRNTMNILALKELKAEYEKELIFAEAKVSVISDIIAKEEVAVLEVECETSEESTETINEF